jgi:hypothetical protein
MLEEQERRIESQRKEQEQRMELQREELKMRMELEGQQHEKLMELQSQEQQRREKLEKDRLADQQMMYWRCVNEMKDRGYDNNETLTYCAQYK